jgi:hypothetical protein
MGPPPVAPQPATDGFAIAAMAFGIVGSALISVPLGLIALHRIKRSGGAKTGKGLAAAGMAIGCLWLAVIPVMVLTGFAGSAGPDTAEDFGGEEHEVALVAERFQEDLVALGDADCDEVLTRRYIEEIESRNDESCESFFDSSAGYGGNFTIDDVTIRGDTATVDASDFDRDLRFHLVDRDGWLIDAIYPR